MIIIVGWAKTWKRVGHILGKLKFLLLVEKPWEMAKITLLGGFDEAPGAVLVQLGNVNQLQFDGILFPGKCAAGYLRHIPFDQPSYYHTGLTRLKKGFLIFTPGVYSLSNYTL